MRRGGGGEEGVRRCQKMKAGLKEGRISFLPSLFANKPRYVSPSVHRLPFLTLHMSVRNEDGDGEGEDEGAHDVAPPRTDPAFRRRRTRVRHRGFRSRVNPSVAPRALDLFRPPAGPVCTLHHILHFGISTVAALKHAPPIFLAAESLLFTFTIFLTVKSSAGRLCGF